MKKILFLLFLLILLFQMELAGNILTKPGMKKLAILPEILKPGMIIVREGKLFVTEGANISIYSMSDFKLLNTFGKQGEGPQEFKLNSFGGQLIIDVSPINILVNSLGKLSYFTLDGEFIKEIKNPAAFYIQPINENYVGMSSTISEKNTHYLVINLYDGNLNKIKEVFRREHEIQVQNGKGIHLLEQSFVYSVAGDKIFISGKDGFVVDIYNKQGHLLKTIERKNYKKRRVTDTESEEIHQLLKRQLKELYEFYKHAIVISPYFPAIANIIIRDETLLILTNTEINQMWEIYVYNLEGEFIMKMLIPIVKRDLITPFPTDIRNGNVYQLIEDEETEIWELYVSEIK